VVVTVLVEVVAVMVVMVGVVMGMTRAVVRRAVVMVATALFFNFRCGVLDANHFT
jgi:hypothetical protein